MKQHMVALTILLCIKTLPTYTIDEIDNHFTYENNEYSSWYQTYFTLKESINFHMAVVCHIGIDKLNQTKLGCSQCTYKFTAFSVWEYLIDHNQKKLIDQFLTIAKEKSSQELAAFILQMYQDLKVPCKRCKKYANYYVIDRI